MRACDDCIRNGEKCVELIVLMNVQDCEAAMKMINSKREDNEWDQNLVCSMALEAAHLCKCLKASFANWWLFLEGQHCNLSLICTLRENCRPEIKIVLKQLVSLKAVRNHDRMDVSYMLQVVQPGVSETIAKAQYVIQTIVPEIYRVHATNKQGVITKPYGICCGPFGIILLVELAKSVLFSIRLHYPVEITIIGKDLSKPKVVTYSSGITYVAHDSGIVYTDVSGAPTHSPMSLKVLETK